MNKRDRLIYVTEQHLRGFHVVFDDRWDHHLALEALGSEAERLEFDRWAYKRIRKGGYYRPVPHLVVDFLWPVSSPKRRQDGTLEWYGRGACEYYRASLGWEDVVRREARAQALHTALISGRKARKEKGQLELSVTETTPDGLGGDLHKQHTATETTLTFAALQPTETTLSLDFSLALA